MATSGSADVTWIATVLARRRLWGCLAVLVALAIGVGSLLPASELPEQLPWDKLNHLLGYAALAGLGGLAMRRLGPVWLAATVYGLVIELAQIPVPGRLGGDPWDMFANALGAAFGVALAAALRRLAGP